MPYKPKFCCQCGEKIERVDWKLWTSRRFCELCATDFGVYDKMPLILVSASVLFGLFGIGSYWRTPEKAVNVAPNQFTGSAATTNKAETVQANQPPQVSSNASVQTPAQTKNETVPVAAQNLKSKPLQAPAQETVYFCGAMTKKGTPCSRRVKNGGRCWQHEGQAAMLPQEKLIVKNN
jgi:hypothetical protein